MPKLIDSHTHLQFSAFKQDRNQVIEKALSDNIWLINVGTQKDTSLKAIEISEKYQKGVYATVGLHPIHTQKSYFDPQEFDGNGGFTSLGEKFDYEFYKKLAVHPKVVAIGETGLDYYRIGSNDLEARNLQ